MQSGRMNRDVRLRAFALDSQENRMIRSSKLAVLALALMVYTGCDNAADAQKNANEAQNDANIKIQGAKDEAAAKARTAQADADRKVADAQANFLKLREDYRHDMTINLVELDKRVALLDVKVKGATGMTKTNLDESLRAIHPARSTFGTKFSGLEDATAVTWDAAKKTLEKEWIDLKAMVDKA